MTIKMDWSHWHLELHKRLQANPLLLPQGESLLLSISGGQDSMALLKLTMDLQRIYKWRLYVWHGNHKWHQDSDQICSELESWCKSRRLSFFSNVTNQKEVSNEAKARDWRYKCLTEIAQNIIKENPEYPSLKVLTGHTGSDRAETFIQNLSRGADLKGLSSQREIRVLYGPIDLIRPLLIFSRNDTLKICKEMNLPIWQDPTNESLKISRNRIRKQVLPILEELHPGCSRRIAALGESLVNYENNQAELTKLALKALYHSEGLYRKEFNRLSINTKSILLAYWLKISGVPVLTRAQLKELSISIGEGKPPGSRNLQKGWRLFWGSESIQLKQEK